MPAFVVMTLPGLGHTILTGAAAGAGGDARGAGAGTNAGA